jgi:serine/threonine-protein kinase RsbW
VAAVTPTPPPERGESETLVEGDVELVLPADAHLVRIARLVASGVAGIEGFDVDEVDDLRIAVDEGCAALLEGGDGSPLLVSFSLEGGAVDVFGTTRAGDGAVLDPDRLSLSRQILSVVVEDHTLLVDAGQVSFRFRKRRARTVPDDG